MQLQQLPEKLINLTPIQVDYLKDNAHRFIVLPAGRRSRKTLLGKRKILLAALNNNNHRYFMAAPTYQQAKNIFWSDLKRDTRLFWYRYPSETELKVELVNGSMIAVVGLDKPMRIEGIPWNGCLITEMSEIKANAWAENIRPLLADTGGFALLDGTPNGLGDYYDLALYAAGGPLPQSVAYTGAYAENADDDEWAYYHWFSSDVLPQSEIESAKRQLSPKMYEQEYEGSFIGNTNRVYDMFDRGVHRQEETTTGMQLGCGIDFNVSAMTAEVFAYDYSKKYVHFIKEYVLKNSNTFNLAATIAKDYPGIRCFPDPAGSARHSSATRSDHQILKDSGLAVRSHKGHPPVRDRVNAFNSMLKNAAGDIRCTINGNCKSLIADMERLCWLPNGDVDKTNLELSHASDAAGYAIEYLFPIRGSYNISVIS